MLDSLTPDVNADPVVACSRAPVLIIGAGCCGLSLAQGLKNSGIASIVYEQDDAPNSRSRDWNFSLHWAVPTLKSLVSTELFSRIDSTQVDPHQQPLETEILNMVNGATGEVLRSIPIPASYRMRRSKLKALLAEGIDVRYKKELQNIRYSEDGETVTAQFGDGTIASGCLLVGVDGSRSRIRNLLLGPKEAALSPIPYAASFVQCQYSREQALFLRKSFRLFVAAIHPLGLFSWFGLHDVPDPDRPETWIFYTYISYPSSIQEQSETADWTNAMKMEHLKGMAKDFADPWKSAYAWMPADRPVWQHGMTSWDPSTRGHRWETSGGRVTLGGDAAHPMTYQRGQALNHAITDAAEIMQAVVRFSREGAGVELREEAISTYEESMRRRAGEEVRLCDSNTAQLHDWEQVKESPVMKSGLQSLHK